MAEKLSMIPLDQIRPPKNPIRRDIDRQGVVELSDSIRKLGLIEPLILERSGKRYRVVAGHRRYLACKMAGLNLVPAIVVEMDDLKKAAVSWHENEYRADVKPEHEAAFIRELMERHNTTQADIATLVGKSVGWISDRLRILQYPEVLRQAMNDGTISFAVARELVHITDPSELHRLVDIAAQNGCSARTAASWRQAWQARQAAPTAPPLRTQRERQGEPGVGEYKVTCMLCRRQISAAEEQIIRVCPACYRAVMSAAESQTSTWPQPPQREVPSGT